MDHRGLKLLNLILDEEKEQKEQQEQLALQVLFLVVHQMSWKYGMAVHGLNLQNKTQRNRVIVDLEVLLQLYQQEVRLVEIKQLLKNGMALRGQKLQI